MIIKKILIATIGENLEPVIENIKRNKPDYCAFLCSDTGDPKTSSTEDVPKIIEAIGIKELPYKTISLKDLDDLNYCFNKAWKTVKRFQSEYPDAKIICDYTGGTKSMGAGLAMAATFDGEVTVSILKGKRQNKAHLTGDIGRTIKVHVQDILARFRVKMAERFLENYDYSGSYQILNSFLESISDDGIRQEFDRLLYLSRCFSLWDKFDHAGAIEILRGYKESDPQNIKLRNYYLFINSIVRENGHGFELVEDLLMNAKRCVIRERLDDAVGRLYRAIEMTAQIWLLKFYEIDCNDIDIDKLPESKTKERMKQYSTVNNDKVRIGLRDAWDIILSFDDDASKLYQPVKDDINSFMAIRNKSLFAHGKEPICEKFYNEIVDDIEKLLNNVIDIAAKKIGKKRFEISQLPNDIKGF